jgi:hypothetical protein
MAITHTEDMNSRRWTVGDEPVFEARYHIFGSTSETAVRSYVERHLPTKFEGLYRERYDLEPDLIDTVTNVGRWKVVLRFTPYLVQGQAFDTSGGKFHLTQSLKTSGIYTVPGAPVYDHQGGIGIRNGRPEGVDISYPTYEFTETYHFFMTLVTSSYRGSLFRATGTINNRSFRGFAEGECLFLGVTGSLDGRGIWELQFRFACSPTKTEYYVGAIKVPVKRGWEYQWVDYEETDDPTQGVTLSVPRAVYIEQVYPISDFARLGIGTGSETIQGLSAPVHSLYAGQVVFPTP